MLRCHLKPIAFAATGPIVTTWLQFVTIFSCNALEDRFNGDSVRYFSKNPVFEEHRADLYTEQGRSVFALHDANR
jgi:hypothetical protein